MSRTQLQIGVQCAFDCRDSARESLGDEEYRAYVMVSLEIFRREAERLLQGEVLRATRDGADR